MLLFGEGDALEQIEIYDVPKLHEDGALVCAVVDFHVACIRPDLPCKDRCILADRHRGPRLRLEEACVFSEHLGFKSQGFEGKHTAAFSGWMSSRTGAVNEASGLLSK